VAHIARQTLGFYRDTTVPVTISLPQLMSSLLEMYSSRIHNKELRIQTRYETDQVVSGRLGEIRQIFSNLIANAIDAAPLRGSLVVHVAASRNWKSPRQTGIRVSIADDGKGIPVHLRPKLFEPFFSTKQHYGTGLGLWVSKSLAEKHGGYIRFRSSVQESCHGSVFSVFLPAEPEAAAVPSAA
jgi:signal transduction histidine kinase